MIAHYEWARTEGYIAMFQILSSLLTGIVAGALVRETMGPVRSDDTALEIHTGGRPIGPLRMAVPILMGLSVLSTALTIAVEHEEVYFIYAVVAFILSLSALTVSIVAHHHLHTRFRSWDPGRLPADASQHAQRWSRSDAVRMVLAVGAFLSCELARPL